jgi:hypothetical protein
MTGDPRYAHAVQDAVDYAVWSQNPGAGWRYTPRDGESDTHVTIDMTTFLRIAELAGADVPPESFAGAVAWIDRMTWSDGRVGYNSRGGAPARPEGLQDDFPAELAEPMTAGGIWTRQLAGSDAVRHPANEDGIAHCLAILPSWQSGRRDLYYFHFGSLALHEHGAPGWAKWERAVSAALLAPQQANGSWPTADVWSRDGGRVYTTAMSVLTLLTPYRYPQGTFTKPDLSRAEHQAARALKAALKDDDASVREAAAGALRQFTR